MIFRQISGLNEHDPIIMKYPGEDASLIAQETIAYEKAWLNQMIQFYQKLQDRFLHAGDRHVRKRYDQMMREFKKGKEFTVFVYHNQDFIPHTVTIHDYAGIVW